MKENIIRISDRPELMLGLAEWFHSKWGIPTDAYLDSMSSAIEKSGAYPEWYAVIDEGEIVAGAGVIDNDFHPRKDLEPNVCALYVIPEHRGRGIAGELLEYISLDTSARGTDTLYLVTDHTSFYERYGWKYLCPVVCDGEDHDSRIYVKRSSK